MKYALSITRTTSNGKKTTLTKRYANLNYLKEQAIKKYLSMPFKEIQQLEIKIVKFRKEKGV